MLHLRSGFESHSAYRRLSRATLSLMALALSVIGVQAAPAVEVSYSMDSVPLIGRYYPPANPKLAKAPGIVLFPDWMGVTEISDESAKRVSGLGYAVLVADVYGKNNRPKSQEEAGKLSSIYKNDRALMRARGKAALAALKKQKGVDTNAIAAMGYCFGGTCALELARSGANLKGVVTLHGGLDTPTPQDAANIKGKVVVLHGADDPYVPAQQVANFMDEMRQGKVDWQMNFYGNAVHGFSNPKAPRDTKAGYAYTPEADHRSFEAYRLFYQEIFPAD